MSPRKRLRSKSLLLLAIAAAALLCAFQPQHPEPRALRKIASVPQMAWQQLIVSRRPAELALDEENKLPWRAIGRVLTDNGSPRCTGTLVGSNLVLTAEHCLIFTDPSQGKSAGAPRANHYFFQPFRSKDMIPVQKALLGSDLTGQGHQSDYAILILEGDAGDRYGYLDIRSLSDDEAQTTLVTSATYGAIGATSGAGPEQDDSLAANFNCRILTSIGSVYQTDCGSRLGSAQQRGTMMKGEAGAPLLVFDHDGRASVSGILAYETDGNEHAVNPTDAAAPAAQRNRAPADSHLYEVFVKASNFQDGVLFERQK